jgi:cGMP-dependent protein kinase
VATSGHRADEDIQLIESVAYEMMPKFGYTAHLVGVSTKPTAFSEADVRNFATLNHQGIQKMNAELQKENPADLKRRQLQSEILEFKKVRLEEWCDDDVLSDSVRGLLGTALSLKELASRLECGVTHDLRLLDGRNASYATASQRGYYPNEPDKLNQDATHCQVDITNNNLHWFSVFDGHGPAGDKCSSYAATHLPHSFISGIANGTEIKTAILNAHRDVHEQILADPTIDATQSGTTAITVLLEEEKCLVSNVGDSACILGSFSADGTTAINCLSTEQTPSRADERKRIEQAGGVILTVDQKDGRAPLGGTCRRLAEAPLRIWSQDTANKFPGCCFTRSLGDSIAHSLGVIARPEIFETTLNKEDQYVLIICSDGITECTLMVNDELFVLRN